MILIADAGSTKVEWCVAQSLTDFRTFETPGINALHLSEDALKEVFRNTLGNLKPDKIYYYGAGCATPEICNKVADALPSNCAIEVHSDMLGAARALFGHDCGLALVLGTGSNSALYNGRSLTQNMPPLGYILGDEGSGTAMGKRLLNLSLRSGFLRPELENWLGMNYGMILKKIYSQPETNKFLASLVPFIVDHAEQLSSVIDAEFDALFDALSAYYKIRQHIRVVGGLAFALQTKLHNRAELHGFTIDMIQQRPMPGLISYHLS